MTETPNDPDVTPVPQPAGPGSDPDTLHDGDMPAPYPDDTPGGVQDDPESDGETADLAADAERLSEG